MAAEKVVKKVKAPAKKAEHPTYAAMIVAAVKALAEKKGSSMVAIKKYVIANNKVGDEKKAANRVRLALKKAVLKKVLLAPKGSAGKYKLAPKAPKVKKAKKAKKPKKAKKVKKPKKVAAKKPKAAKKPAAKKPKSPKKAAKPKPAKKAPAKKAAKPAAKKAAKSPKKAKK